MLKPWLIALGTLLLAGCTYRVDSLVDAVDANPGDYRCERAIPEDGLSSGDDDGGLCTLRAAIMEANARPWGVDRIEIPPGEYRFILPTNVGGGRLEITEDVEIQGAGAEITTIDGDGADLVFYVTGGEVAINNVTVRGGQSTGGAGIRIEGATVEMHDIVLRDNSAGTGGGGILVDEDATATIRRGTIIENSAIGAFGGGIWNRGQLFVFDTTIADNESNRAGGIHNSGILNLRNTTVSGNRVNSPEAGVGGIAQTEFAVLNNVTVTDNTGVGNNPNSFRGGGLLTSSNANTVLKNSIVAGNDGGIGPNDCVGTLSGDSKYNLIGDSDGCTINSHVLTYLLDVDPQLDFLNSNGGPTSTHRLLSDSPAIGAAFPFDPGGPAADACEGLDQRGVPRPQNDNPCDMGAYEFGSIFAIVDNFVLVDADADVDIRPLLHGDRIDLSTLPDNLSIRIAITGAAADSVVFGFDDDPAFRTENIAPYALGGDNAGDYAPVALETGHHVITATPFADDNGGGAAGISLSIGFEVVP